MKRIVLIRHGESQWNKENRFTGWTNVDLSEKGLEEALEDFRFIDGKIRALESTTDSLYAVSDYQWSGFGMKFDHFIIKGVDKQTALKTFSQ